MKVKHLFCIVAIMTISIVAIAKDVETLPIESHFKSGINHKINGYKYLCMEDQGNQYDLEDKFNAFFESIGFIILTPDDEEELDDDERQYVLYGTYVCQLMIGAASNLTLTLRNSDGKIIFSSSKEGMGFASPKSDFKKASNKIINQLQNLNYSFDPTLNLKKKKKVAENEEEHDE